MANSIGDRIRKEREKRGETQFELGQKLHVAHTAVSKWEKTSNVPLDKIELLARYFNVSCDYLIFGIKPENVTMYYETGLSEESVFALSVNDKKLATSVNYLVENGCSFTIDAISRYLAESAQIHIDSVEEPLTKEQTESLAWLLENIMMAKLSIRKVVCNRCSKKD